MVTIQPMQTIIVGVRRSGKLIYEPQWLNFASCASESQSVFGADIGIVRIPSKVSSDVHAKVSVGTGA